ncbi:hypothetical protein FB451DRAFT_1449291 [Mycena latifolia]|nr:hypothetical protein FB451DRAFT_1449291 [Mycena latifolia]
MESLPQPTPNFPARSVTSEEHKKFMEDVDTYVNALNNESDLKPRKSVGAQLTALVFLNSLHTRGWGLKDLVYRLMDGHVEAQEASQELKRIWAAYQVILEHYIETSAGYTPSQPQPIPGPSAPPGDHSGGSGHKWSDHYSKLWALRSRRRLESSSAGDIKPRVAVASEVLHCRIFDTLTLSIPVNPDGLCLWLAALALSRGARQ